MPLLPVVDCPAGLAVPPRVLLIPAALNQHLDILRRAEDSSILECIPQLAVDVLDVSILPGTFRLGEQ
jgi:hypothetical protein